MITPTPRPTVPGEPLVLYPPIAPFEPPTLAVPLPDVLAYTGPGEAALLLLVGLCLLVAGLALLLHRSPDPEGSAN